MSDAKPKTTAHKLKVYGTQTGHITARQARQLRRTENHLLASARRQEDQKRLKRSHAAKKAAQTRALKKKLKEQGIVLDPTSASPTPSDSREQS
jgi:hypothetical protein